MAPLAMCTLVRASVGECPCGLLTTDGAGTVADGTGQEFAMKATMVSATKGRGKAGKRKTKKKSKQSLAAALLFKCVPVGLAASSHHNRLTLALCAL